MSDISQHIDLTSSQIERLRSKFAKYESPPSFYYEQQEEYTNKLQDFNVRKQMLQEQIHQVWPLVQSGGSYRPPLYIFNIENKIRKPRGESRAHAGRQVCKKKPPWSIELS